MAGCLLIRMPRPARSTAPAQELFAGSLRDTSRCQCTSAGPAQASVRGARCRQALSAASAHREPSPEHRPAPPATGVGASRRAPRTGLGSQVAFGGGVVNVNNEFLPLAPSTILKL